MLVGVAGFEPATPTSRTRDVLQKNSMISVKLDRYVRGHPFAFGFGISVGILSGPTQRVDRIGLVVRMVVAIDPLKHLKRDAKETADLVRRDAELCLPGDCGMPQCVRNDIRPESGGFTDRPETPC